MSLSVEQASIHCLAGENGSGKSTLIKIIAGTLKADEGQVFIHGHEVTRVNALGRIDLGLSVIYQDFSLLPNLSVFENITFLDSISRHHRMADFRRMRKQAQQILEKMRVRIPLDTLVEELPVSNQQLVAIACALSNRSKVIIMDEPTSALTRREVRALFKIVHTIREECVSFVFVTHKLDEIYEICDHVTVIRNGRVVTSGVITEYSTAQLSEAITGRRIQIERIQPAGPDAEVPSLLEVHSLTAEPHYRDVSFQVRHREIVGLTGLLGSGRSELALALAGKMPPDSGTMRLDGQEIHPLTVREAQRLGVGYVPEDRLGEGLFLEQAIFKNMLIANMDLRTKFGLLEERQIRRDGKEYLRQLDIKAQDGRDPVQTLSGGNQQRVLIARYLDLNPKLLIMNGPTIGVDVGSKQEIHHLIAKLAEAGTGILLVSDDLPELLGLCHRILVIADGKLTNEHLALALDLRTLAREITME
ncbi:MAG: sugar ABC transporter ATP-binding protein [Verrucomicrobia bacterium]|nr:sugar ABC transporter ATP-binding protein [Verrucomicrobiota bacterium]